MQLRYESQTLDLTGIKAVIFDLDGTLVESEPVWAEAKQYIAHREHVDVSAQVLSAYVGRSVIDFVREVISETNSQQIADDLVARALSRYEDNVHEISGAAKLVQTFASNGFATAICSSAPLVAIQKCMQALNISACIDVVVSTEALAKGKPDKFPYEETLRQLAVPSQSALVFEDAPAGLTSALSAGLKTICVGHVPETAAFPCAMFAKNIGEIEWEAV